MTWTPQCKHIWVGAKEMHAGSCDASPVWGLLWWSLTLSCWARVGDLLRRWGSAAVQDIRGLPRRQQQQQHHHHAVHPQVQALQMPAYHDAAAHPLADRLASCHISPVMGCSHGLVPATVTGVSAVTAGLAASMPAHTLQQSGASVMPAAAYPPPGLQAVQVSQPGLLALPHGVPGTSGLSSGGVSGALSPAALQLGHLLPLPMLQAMMPPAAAAAEAGAARLAADACGYPQQQQVQGGHFMMQGHQPQGGLACTPLQGYGVPQVGNQARQQTTAAQLSLCHVMY